MANIITNINQACADLTNIKTAITDAGVTVASGTPSSEYASKIGEVYDSGYIEGFDIGEALGKEEEYDKFWDAYQDGGNRTEYRQAFAGYGWKAEIFKPKHDMYVTYGYMMFMNSQISIDLPDTLGIILDFANSTNLQYTFNTTKFTRIGVVDGRKAGQFADTFGYSYYIQTIDKIICDENTTFTSNCFNSCRALTNIEFEGVIGSTINFQWCPLTKASITNVINALSSSVTGKTVTFKKSAKEAAFTAEEWATLIATKSNWTFSLV